MKLIVITILAFGFFSCNNLANKKMVDYELAKDSLVQVNSLYNDKNEINESAKYKEQYDCDFDKFINDPKTPKLAKDIYLNKEWNLNNDNEALALLDSLTAKDKSSRPFYFKVVTLSKKKSDGYYSEGLGLAGYEFVENNTQEFTSYFDNKQCHTDSDLTTWADIVISEFSISGEGSYDKPIVDDYIKNLKTNCKNCSKSQKETINKFGLTLKEKWEEFLKNVD